MYCVVIIKRLDDKPLTNANQLPSQGQIIGNAADILGEDEGLFPYDEAIVKAREYNAAELLTPNGTWAIVQRDDEQVIPGTLVNLQDANGLN